MSQSEEWKKAHGRPPYGKPAPKKGNGGKKEKADEGTSDEGGSAES